MLRHQDLYYVTEVGRLLLGGNYSNERILVRLLADLSIGGLWCARDDQQYCGKWKLDFFLAGERIPPTTTEFAPEYQRTRYLRDSVSISKTVFVPVVGDRQDIVYVIVEAYNGSRTAQTVGVSSDVRYPEMGWAQFVKFPDREQRSKRVESEQSASLVISRTKGREDEVRAIGGALAIVDAQMDDESASIVFEPLVLESNESVTLPFGMAVSPFGVEEALMTLAQIENHRDHFYATQSFIRDEVINVCQVATPDGLINRAVAWAKVNSFRQCTRYPSGYGFTNDPPQDVMVVRDAAWFALGSDYFMPAFSREMLKLVQRHGIEAGGKITEYIQCCENPPYHFDYDLNINDDTPLFVAAVYHHFVVTRDEEALRALYPAAHGAIEWIIKQKLGGLIHCSSEESNVWGICSWRNIIPGYNLSGAVTEINAECYHALRCMSQLAQYLGMDEDASRYAAEAAGLRDAINTRLISGKTGVFVLNVDTQGVEHHDLTGDLVFPTMFGVADRETERRVLDILYTPMFWTDFGMRTVAVGEANYDPEFGVRLMGGIWPNLTVWVAYANRDLYPNRMIEGMRNAYRICEVDNPKRYKNLVPGEFPECLHGENFESRGMALSPWMPPTYLWLAMEGMLGFEPGVDGLKLKPHLAADWRWAAGRAIPYAGRRVTFFYFDGTIYTTISAQSEWPQEYFEADISTSVSCNAFTVALRSNTGRVVILVATDAAVLVELEVPEDITGQTERSIRFSLAAGDARLLEYP